MTRKSKHKPACFVICPLGDEDSDARGRSDRLLKHIIDPAASEHGLQVVRSDKISLPGIISSQIIREILTARLVVADLTDRNPNVFYELALRHAFAKPVVQMILKGQDIPFDVAPTRTISYSLELDDVATARDELSAQMSAALATGFRPETPVSTAASIEELYQKAHPETEVLESILEQVATLRDSVSELSRLQRPAAVDSTIPQYVQDHVEEVLSRYKDEIELLKSVRYSGITGVFKRRQMAITDFSAAIDEEPTEIMVVGSSLKGLLQKSEYEDIADKLKFKNQHGISVKFLLTHPIVADFRASQENRRPTEIGREIIASLSRLSDWGIPQSNVRLYLGTPTCFAIKTSHRMLVNPYPYVSVSYDSPCLCLEYSSERGVERPGYFFDEFSSRHFGAWDSDLSVEIAGYAETISRCQARLEEYASDVDTLLEKGKTLFQGS